MVFLTVAYKAAIILFPFILLQNKAWQFIGNFIDADN